MDELTCVGENIAYGVGSLGHHPIAIDLKELGLKSCSFNDLAGGDVSENMDLLARLLIGKAPDGLRDTIVLNAGAGLWISEHASSLKEGVALARDVLENGRLAQWFEQVKTF